MSVIPFPSARPVPRAASARCAPSWPALWLRRLRHRRALAALDRDQIRDAGLDPVMVRAEIAKPVWRA